MKLNEYPEAIASLRLKLAHLETELSQQQETAKFLEASIEFQVASDASLKNESQRKARKLELLQSNPDYFRENNKYRDLKLKHKILEIDLLLKIDEFAIAKLEERRAIIEMEQSLG